MRIAGICGSLRAASYNRALLRAAIDLAPEGVTIEPAEIRDVPPYDGDVEARGVPDVVGRLRERLAAADAVLFVSPEYNFSIPGVLKNAIDWVSRRPDPPLAGKPGAIMGASIGALGTARMQYQLRQTALALNIQMLGRPEVLVGKAQEKFDASGTLTDEATRKAVAAQLVALRDWTLRLRDRP